MKKAKPTKKPKGEPAAEKTTQTTSESTAVNGSTGEGPARALVVAGTAAVLADEPGSGKLNAQPLTAQERKNFHRCEVEIEENKDGPRKLAAAVYEVWCEGYYREDYGSFEDCLRHRWNFSRPYGYMLLQIHLGFTKVSR